MRVVRSKGWWGGIRSNNSVQTPSEWRQLAPNNGSISVFQGVAANKGIVLALEYCTRYQQLRSSRVACMLDRNGGGVLWRSLRQKLKLVIIVSKFNEDNLMIRLSWHHTCICTRNPKARKIMYANYVYSICLFYVGFLCVPVSCGIPKKKFFWLHLV